MTKIKTAHNTGLRAEAAAAWLLRLKGYRIVARRYKCPVGEIDIIARRGKNLVFAEVKARTTLDDALSCLRPQNIHRITRAAQHYLAAHGQEPDVSPRFDFIALAPPFAWRHLDNAWITAT